MIQPALAALIGVIAGLHSATWGMFKDAPHEGFTWRTYLRSPVLSAVLAVSASRALDLDLDGPAAFAILFGVTYALERALLEIYKTFIRDEDQSKYTIPMQLAVKGKLVRGRAVRLSWGALYLAVELMVLFGVHWLQRSGPRIPDLLAAALVGSAGGWISAGGGAWKDAPVEGFHLLKFFRSPLVAGLYGVFMAALTTRYVVIFLGAIGYTVASLETHKTFFHPNEDRGKFMHKTPGYPEWLRIRYRFVPLYVLIWLTILVTAALALVRDRQGLVF